MPVDVRSLAVRFRVSRSSSARVRKEGHREHQVRVLQCVRVSGVPCILRVVRREAVRRVRLELDRELRRHLRERLRVARASVPVRLHAVQVSAMCRVA
jgi:hypothetical protein